MTEEGFDRRCLPATAMIGQWTARDGARLRTIAFAPDGPARGAILFASGRGDFAEKYLESLVHWRRHGWHVTAFDWRGQGGSGRGVAGPQIGHVDDFGQWVDDLAALIDDWRVQTPGPHVAIGHSMGGHLLMRCLAEHQPPLDGAVLCSPMFGIGGLPRWIICTLAMAMVKLGRGRQLALGQKLPKDLPHDRRAANLTGSTQRYADERWWVENHPELALGGASWGWLAAACRSFRRLGDRRLIARVRLPVLIVAAERDHVVQTSATIGLARSLPDHALVLLPGAHELLREADGPRLAAWAAIDEFLEVRTR